MDVETKLELVKGFSAEIITEPELRSIFETNDHPAAYDGFEPSGIAPIHFGLLRARNLKKMIEAGIHFKLYLADYFAFLNDKLGGDLDNIRHAGEYFVEVWKACGVDTGKVEIVWAKDLMDGIDYWDRFMRVGKAITLERIKRAVTIMGRKEGELISAGQLFYPAMQVTDIFQLPVDICQLGMDQRRANVLAREVSEKYKWPKPAAVHHPLVLGLQGMPPGKSSNPDGIIEYKMSKSNPKSAIYMHDSYEEIKTKVGSAYCPERVVEGNPLFNYLELILLKDKKENIVIDRPQKFGGRLEAADYNELVSVYKAGKLHPSDLKSFVADLLEEEIRPAREYFEKNKRAKELYEVVKKIKITK